MDKTELSAGRLFLRPWQKDDAEALFLLAKDPEVGPRCGWLPHRDVKESRMILEKILINSYTWAIVRKEDGILMGNISLMPYGITSLAENDSEAEIGFWLGRPYWNRGYMTEACARILRFGFEERSLRVIYCRHAEANTGSGRVQEKCGLRVYARETCDLPGLYHGGVSLRRRITLPEWQAKQEHHII